MNFTPQFGHEDDDPSPEPRHHQLDERLREALRQKEWLDELTKCKGWGIIRQFVDEQCQRRVNEVMLVPAAATPEVAAQVNMTRGEYAGMKMILVHIDSLQEEAQAIIEAFKEQE